MSDRSEFIHQDDNEQENNVLGGGSNNVVLPLLVGFAVVIILLVILQHMKKKQSLPKYKQIHSTVLPSLGSVSDNRHGQVYNRLLVPTDYFENSNYVNWSKNQ